MASNYEPAVPPFGGAKRVPLRVAPFNELNSAYNARMNLSIVDGVAILRMQAGKANAMTIDFLDGLQRLMDELEASPARAAVLIGYERFFSAGLALPMLVDLDRPTMKRFIGKFADAMLRVFECGRPIVAALNGHAIAGGCVLALQCDWRVAADVEARIGLNEVQLGIGLPAIVIETLRAQVPAASMVPIALEGRLFSPREALALDLVHEVVAADSLEQHAIDRARALAAAPSAAVEQVKRALRRPAIERIEIDAEGETDRWLDTWFAPGAQTLLRETVARVSRKMS